MKCKAYFIFFIVLSILAGCVPAGSLPNLRSAGDASEKKLGDFIELKDGRIIEGNLSKEKLNLGSSKLFNSTGSVAINGKKYGYTEVVAIQKGDKYYRKDAYNAFDERIVKGRINGYRSEHVGAGMNNQGMTTSYDHFLYYLQKGDKAPVVAYELKVLKKMIQDYQPAVDEYEKFNALSKKQKRIKGEIYLTNVINIYNNQ